MLCVTIVFRIWTKLEPISFASSFLAQYRLKNASENVWVQSLYFLILAERDFQC